MNVSERLIQHTNRGKQLPRNLREMEDFARHELTMKILFGPSSKFEHLIVWMDAVPDDGKVKFDVIKVVRYKIGNQFHMELRRKYVRDYALLERSDNRRTRRFVLTCIRCMKREPIEPMCRQKYLLFKPV